MLRSIFLSLLAFVSMTGLAIAADPVEKAAHQSAMQKFGFLVGEWEGGGTMAMGPGPRSSFVQTERIQFKHDGTLLLIEGNGKTPAGMTVHDALAVISFDQKTGTYKFRSFVAVGRFGEFVASVNGNTLVWTISAGPQTMRYNVVVLNGLWKEIGERSTDGTTWTPFFEMTLKRK